MEGLNQHIFFCTLTYNNAQIPELVLENPNNPNKPYNIRYTDYADVCNMIKRIRAYNRFGRDFRYLAVTELGSKKGRPHVHILFFVPKEKNDTFTDIINLEKKMFDSVLLEWRRNYGSKRNPDYQPLCTYIRRMTRRGLSTTYDLHYCNPVATDGGIADVGFYVTKYMTKPSKRAERLQQALHLNLEENDYERIWNKIKPRCFASLGFGLNPTINPKTHKIESIDQDIKTYLKRCISKTIGEYDGPRYINPHDGKIFPLARYYYNVGEILDWKDMVSYYMMRKNAPLDNVTIDERDRGQLINAERKFYRQTRLRIDANQFDFNELFT